MANFSELFDLGNAFYGQGKFAEAAQSFRDALSIDPQCAMVYNNLGGVLIRQGKFAEAADCYRQALRIDPNFADAYFNLGLIFNKQGLNIQAVECFRQVLSINPQNAEAHNLLGSALAAQKQLGEAAACFRQALHINPNHGDAAYNLGSALIELDQPAEAADCFRQALRIHPDRAETHNNLGGAYLRLGQLDEAARCYEQALALDPNHALAMINRTHLRLRQGDFAAAWPDYERRWVVPGMVTRSFPQPRWDGSLLHGKTILVYAEQGLGDTIHFARYLPMVKQRGGKVILECQTALVSLLTGIEGADQVVAIGSPLPPFDVQFPLLSLPGHFGTTLATIPADIPYLRLGRAEGRKHSRDVKEPGGLRPSARHLHVGIVWQGSMNQKCDRRSVPLAYFEALARLEGVHLVSLQVGSGSEQIANVSFPITDLGSRFNPHSLEDLAAALVDLDLVITVDTACAHLAGALGVPVWVALNYVSCWRWLLDRSDSPWYPTMRLFRQRRLGEWSEVFERIVAEVQLFKKK